MSWLLIAGDFTPLGGMDRANHALAAHLASCGDDVHLVTHRAWSDLIGRPNVTLHKAWRPLGSHTLGKPFLKTVGRRCARALARRGAHVVVNGGNCIWPGVNWVHYVHAVYGAPGDREAERRALHAARLVVCNSRRTQADVVERIGVDPARVHVVYYGADARFRPADAAARARAKAALALPADRPAALFVGALGDRRKGFDTLFAAWAALCRDRWWDVDLVVAGTGRALPRWRQLAQAAGLEGRIRFLGFREDVPTLTAAADVVVHPARYEAYGLGVHEALTAGVPALVSAAAGVAERYPTELAPLFIRDPEDARALAEQLRGWRRDLEAWRARVQPLAAALGARSWSDMSKEIVALAEQAA
ncbi:MAG TPA: glycosyltransferase family 4 protein [Vicinamibacterales bacterium]|jgi:glycosyltransferase involved in cell wall biosynthesis